MYVVKPRFCQGFLPEQRKKSLLALSQPQGTAVPILNQNLEYLTLLKARGFALLDTEETLNVVQDGSYLFNRVPQNL